MVSLPITRVTLYKHGVGYFERRGLFSGEQLALRFPRVAMDDVLKSLVVLESSSGQVLGVDFATPEDRAVRLARGGISLSAERSLLDLLRDLRGRRVRCVLAEGEDEGEGDVALEGLVIGVDYESEEPLKRALLSLYQQEAQQVRPLPLDQISRIDLLDEAADDVSYALNAARGEEERRSATIRLSPGEHRLLVAYIAPAPAWRVSYRILFDAAANAGASSCLLQGWGLFDNHLDEDLNEVQLTLVAGMPVSFRYRLYEPHTPERPVVHDEERTVSGSIEFEAAPKQLRAMAAPMAFGAAADAVAESAEFTMDALAASAQTATSGQERGELFAYAVTNPVSVGRGRSAMVPIVSAQLPARRELLYNGRKQPIHPVATLRIADSGALTLERGPATVLVEGEYAGEAVVPFTPVGGNLLVSYAVELGIKVSEERSMERKLAEVRLRDDYLLFEEYELRSTGYHIVSALHKDAEVTIEHELLSGYTLADTPEPQEMSAGFARWPVVCLGGSLTRFAVTERRLVVRREHVRTLNGERLRELRKQGLLDAATGQKLGEVLQRYYEIDGLQRSIKQQDKQREALYAQQRQTQGNLTPLGREGDEGALRQRYVAQLNQIEDRLNALAAEQTHLQGEIARLEHEAVAALTTL
jgi:hypothetical protein